MNSDVSNASRIYADSNTLIYLVEGSPEFLPFAEKLFRYAGEQGIALVTSEITIAECLHGAHKQGSEALAEEYRRQDHRQERAAHPQEDRRRNRGRSGRAASPHLAGVRRSRTNSRTS